MVYQELPLEVLQATSYERRRAERFMFKGLVRRLFKVPGCEVFLLGIALTIVIAVLIWASGIAA